MKAAVGAITAVTFMFTLPLSSDFGNRWREPTG